MKVEYFIKSEKIYTSDNLIKKPEISIIMPTYCRGDNGLLERSIKSVLSQSFKEWELIIVDDGSSDSTKKVVERYLKEDNRIVYIRNEINSSLPALRVNQGLLHARGEYIAYQFDDDLWYEDALETLYKEIITKKNLVVVYAAAKYINTVRNTEGILGREFDSLLFERGNIIPNNTVIHKRKLLYLYGAFECNKNMRRLSDWELWRRWSKKIPFIFINKVISTIEALHRGSLAADYRLDIIRAKAESLEKNNLLSLNNILDYDID